jgi:glycolate oxidase FAD binding subunit
LNEQILTPIDEREAAEIVAAAEAPLDIVGAGTRAGFGRPPQSGRRLSTARLTGIVFHEPAEMTLRARAGTPLVEVEAAAAQHGQMLPFEPMDPRVLFGAEGEPTVGGLVATALAGPRRLSAGAMRDNVLGLKFINGRGEIISAGGRVTKNVTGLDLVKIHCGAQGTLGLVTEATFKLLPAPRAEATIVVRRLDDARAVEAMALYRTERLIARLAAFGAKHALTGDESKRMWRAIRDVEFLSEPRNRAIWRASLKPSDAPIALAALGHLTLASLLDHGGGLVWFSTDPTVENANAVRGALRSFAGHVELIRADETLRRGADVFAPLPPTLARLTRGVKASLDPKGLFNLGRMYADI